ncbi:MAG: UV DNA damage repair endonuclease UvsE [Thermodesulfobacteriota bacterium]
MTKRSRTASPAASRPGVCQTEPQPPDRPALRFGLCCIFHSQPIRFRQTTARALLPLSRKERLRKLSAICLENVGGVGRALHYLAKNRIDAFRISTPLLPRYTHPQVGYRLDDLPDAAAIHAGFAAIRAFRRQHDIRLSLHPDQFNVLSSPRPEVVRNTLRELEYQGLLAELAGVEVINLHAGGVYGDKSAALARLRSRIADLPEAIRGRLTLENDDVSFSPADLLPFCRQEGIPFVYDVHHHRCLPDGMSEEEATAGCVETWQGLGREPYFHISSPKNGWGAGSPKPHADYIDPCDFPEEWKSLCATVDVEAKAKELAVLRLMADLGVQP